MVWNKEIKLILKLAWSRSYLILECLSLYKSYEGLRIIENPTIGANKNITKVRTELRLNDPCHTQEIQFTLQALLVTFFVPSTSL
jgi:hypothetical protein